VYSYTESPYFEDIYYVGEVKNIPVNELAKQFPHLNTRRSRRYNKKKKHTNKTNYNTTNTNKIKKKITTKFKFYILIIKLI